MNITSQKSPILSIVMPVYNHPAEVRVMLNSVLANDFYDWELLAVDDGSNVETLNLLQEFSDKDFRIHFLRRKNTTKGAPVCRNEGFREAKGEFVCFFDSDDYIQPFCLRQRVETIQSRPEDAFVVFRNGIYTDKGFEDTRDYNCFGYPIYKNDRLAFCQRTLPFVGWSCIYRRQSVFGVVEWDDGLLSLQDAQFNLECLLNHLHYSYADCPPDYGYRIGVSGSVSNQIYSIKHLDSLIYALDNFYAFVKCARWGYKLALYRGLMFVYTKVAREGNNEAFNTQLLNLLRKYSPGFGRWFAFQLFVLRHLSKWMPYDRARKVAHFFYLRWYRNMIWYKIPRQINSLLKH